MKTIITALFGALSLSSCSNETEEMGDNNLNSKSEVSALFEKLEQRTLAGIGFDSVITGEVQSPKKWSSCKLRRNFNNEKNTESFILQSGNAAGQLSNEFIKNKVKDFPNVEILDNEKHEDLTVNWAFENTKCSLYLIETEGIVELSCIKKKT